MDHGGCNAVVADLRAQFVRSLGACIPRKAAWYSIRSNVVAFACNYGSVAPNNCHPITADNYDRFWASTVRISRDCGSFVAGIVDPPWFGVHFGYMIHYPGLDFCGNAWGSKLDHC
ncbi:hypothetical protein DL98DRAFT_660342 [Cadophora sp. DSE1049]|nr:hypothetical protein DL98DRAFT_660342 [Cadophora sp. DSE1049]